jgi:hypothetical protein
MAVREQSVELEMPIEGKYLATTSLFGGCEDGSIGVVAGLVLEPIHVGGRA